MHTLWHWAKWSMVNFNMLKQGSSLNYNPQKMHYQCIRLINGEEWKPKLQPWETANYNVTSSVAMAMSVIEMPFKYIKYRVARDNLLISPTKDMLL